ncbi:hypothetical protein AB0M47_18685 [Hamadaea sp. NPDC051192]|uniref:hypothetical protein n=1 Tax=Hamadaea sp. NPDC051192 TaxID=3154940 RepID=UPI003447F5A9
MTDRRQRPDRDDQELEQAATLVAGPHDDPQLQHQQEQTERDLAREREDQEPDSDPREDQDPPQPFSGSEH